MIWILATRGTATKLRADPYTETAIEAVHSVVYKPGVEPVAFTGTDAGQGELGTFVKGLEQLSRSQRRETPDGKSDLDQRAERVLRWLDDKDPHETDPFRLLNLSYAATEKEIAQQYHKLSRRTHPDQHSADSSADYWRERQKGINQAYAELSDPQRRAHWRTHFERRTRLLQLLWKIESNPR